MRLEIRRIFTLLLVGFLIFSLIGCSNTHEQSSLPSTTEYSSSYKSELPQHNYLDGYENDAVYNKIAEIENCTSPELLKVLLTNLYGKNIQYKKINYPAHWEEINNPESGDGIIRYLISIISLYDTSKLKTEFNDIYLFYCDLQQAPIFIMDKNGSYLVDDSKWENYTWLEDGSVGIQLPAWSAIDLFLCLHEYADCDGDIENRKYLSEAARSMEWYVEYEQLVCQYVNGDCPIINTF